MKDMMMYIHISSERKCAHYEVEACERMGHNREYKNGRKVGTCEREANVLIMRRNHMGGRAKMVGMWEFYLTICTM